MKPGRNDPCPCGSGKKYKHCCADQDVRSQAAANLSGKRALRIGAAVPGPGTFPPAGALWEAGVIPVGAGLQDDPLARLTLVLIVADNRILHGELEPHPPSEIQGIAALIAGAVNDAITLGAEPPSAIHVRHAEVAAALSPLLAGRQIPVHQLPALATLDHAAAALAESMGGLDVPASAAMAPTWAAWRLPQAMISNLFEAAALYHAAAPWTHLPDDRILTLDLASGGTWAASILGNAGVEFGLALYEDVEDLLQVLDAGGSTGVFTAMRSAVLSLTFNSRSDLPPMMQREVVRSGWQVADARAYPLLVTINTPAGGITTAQMLELTASLGALARFATHYREWLADRAALHQSHDWSHDWSDEESGTIVHYSDYPEATLWDVPASLAPALPEGPNADPGARVADDGYALLEEEEQGFVAGFLKWLAESGASESRSLTDAENVRLFVHSMAQFQGIPLRALTEYDLRIFLYDWFPRKTASRKTAAMRMRGSLRRFFGFLAARGGIIYPWALPLLADKESFETRWDSFPGGFFWDENVRNWQFDLNADLDDRVMLPARELANVGHWGDLMGPREARWHFLLQREWLIWRDELIRRGISDARTLRAELAVRQHGWELQARPELSGKNVSKVVRAERSQKLKQARRRD